MKKLFLMLLFLIPAASYASHHRGHAIGFADQVVLHLNQMDKQLAAFVNAGCQFDDANNVDIDVLFRYSGFIKDAIQSAKAVLENPVGDLDVARRILNRPNSDLPYAVVTRLRGMNIRARNLVGSCPNADIRLRAVFQRITLAWEAADGTIWHINDAIREEIYQDPVFVCSGPNNHC